MEPLNLFLHGDLTTSLRFTLLADVLCCIGIVAALVAGIVHTRALRAGVEPRGGAKLLTRAPLFFLVLATAAMGFAIGNRWIEVNHFPSQTMSEVLQMFSTALLLSMIVLHMALGLQRKGSGWAVLDDVLVALVMASVVFTHMYVRTLPTAQRDLPPALQSYWFAPHLSCLIFSYATMGIAAFVALSYFVMRFWCSVLRTGTGSGPERALLGLGTLFPAVFVGLVFGEQLDPFTVFIAVPLVCVLAYLFVRLLTRFKGSGWRPRTEWAILIGLTCIPFAQVVTWPILLVGGLVFCVLKWVDRLPGEERIAALEKSLDDVSFRSFAVGFPFLTAGLWMGAFWAQEAWANYWGWDSKENSALITWLVYVIYIHLRMLGGYRGTKAMSVLIGGALSVFLTFQIFGYLPDSQKSLHRYTDDGVQPKEGQQGSSPSDEQARADTPDTDVQAR